MKRFLLLAFALSACLNNPEDAVSIADESEYSALTDGSFETGYPERSGRGSLTNVALQGTVTASAVWENNPLFLAERVIDGSTFDGAQGGNYWLLPNETPGWLELDLGKTYKIGLIEILNTNNGLAANDRATKDFRLEIRNAEGKVVHTASGVLPFTSLSSATNPIVPYILDFKKSVNGRYVKIYVDSWYPTRRDPSWPYPTIFSRYPENQGGGLNEVLVFAKSRHKERKNCRKDKAPRLVQGCWNVAQSNIPGQVFTGLLSLSQSGTALSGAMDWSNFPSDAAAEGKISGDSISFALTYTDIPGLIGYYSATLDAAGENLVNGTTVSNNSVSGTWQATKTVCPAGP